MKRLFFELIWQWRNGNWVGLNLIGIEFEYDKMEPSMTFVVVVMGIGLQIVWICPWETKQSLDFKERIKDHWQILSIGGLND